MINIMKSIEKMNVIKNAAESVSYQLRRLTDEGLEQVSGGDTDRFSCPFHLKG